MSGGYLGYGFPYAISNSPNPWDNSLRHVPMNDMLSPFPNVNLFVNDPNVFSYSPFGTPMPGQAMPQQYYQPQQQYYQPQQQYQQPQQQYYQPQQQYQQPQQQYQQPQGGDVYGSMTQMLQQMINSVQQMLRGM